MTRIATGHAVGIAGTTHFRMAVKRRTWMLFFHFAPYLTSLLLIAMIPVCLDELRDEHSMLNLTCCGTRLLSMS